MKKILLTLLVIGLLSATVLAAPGGGRFGDLAFIAWLEEDVVMMAFANESNSYQSVTVRTDTVDSRRRPVFAERTLDIPARSIVYEDFPLSPSWRRETVKLEVGRWYQFVELEVQAEPFLQPSQRVIRAGEMLEVDVDLDSVFAGLENAQLIIDDYYQMIGSITRGPIRVAIVEGGYRYIPARNSVVYVKPEMLLEIRAPQLNNVGVMTFKLVKVVDGYRGYRETIEGPAVLVYGRNLRFAREQEPPRRPPLITR